MRSTSENSAEAIVEATGRRNRYRSSGTSAGATIDEDFRRQVWLVIFIVVLKRERNGTLNQLFGIDHQESSPGCERARNAPLTLTTVVAPGFAISIAPGVV